MIITPSEDLSPQEFVRAHLRIAGDQYRQVAELRASINADRAQLAQIARDRGITNQEIADAYGITETAVRAMIKRQADPQVANCGSCRDQVKPGHYCPECGRVAQDEG